MLVFLFYLLFAWGGNICKRVFVAIEDNPDSFSFLVFH